LQELEEANAFVVALDAARSWFRYHHLLADLLRLHLRRTAPGEVTALHRAAADWFAGHGYPVEAVRHAQGAQDWGLAARLLADHWPGLHLGGQAATIHELLAGFPAEARAGDAELAAVAAADELARGSLEEAERYLELAARGSASVPAGRRPQLQVLLGVVRLLIARERADLPAVAEEAERLRAVAEDPDAAQYDLAPAARAVLGGDLRALALISLGRTEVWTTQLAEAERHLDQGVALARRIGRPYLEFSGLAYRATIAIYRSSLVRAAERSRQAVELADQHGWAEEPAVGAACGMLGAVLAWQGRAAEAEPWVQRAERTIRAEADSGTASMVVHHARGVLELARGQDADALAAFAAAERLAGHLAASHMLVPPTRALRLVTLVRLGETERAGHDLAELCEQDRERGEVRIATAGLRLAQHDPDAAAAALAPVLDGSAPVHWSLWLVEGFLLGAIARDALGDPAAVGPALERALDLAEPDGAYFFFLIHPAPRLLERHARHRTAHASLVAEILGLLGGRSPAPPPGGPRPPLEPLSESEIRVLRYLPTNLSTPEIADELYISKNTVRTHVRHLYAKLGTHHRAEAVARARGLGLLAPAHRR